MDYVAPENDHNLTPKQLAFVRIWIETGNITRSYMDAYEVDSELVAAANGSRLLRNAKVRQYIDAVLEEAKSDLIADTREIMERLTKTARRLEPEYTVAQKKEREVWYETGPDGKQRKMEKSVEYPIVVETPSGLSDSNRALELLGKTYRIFTDRAELEIITPQFIEDVPDDD